MKVLGVNFARSRAEVAYDPAKATVDQMAKALSRYGYTAYPIGENLKRVTLRVEDFGGYEKIPKLEEAIRKIPGVKGVRTDVLRKSMTLIVETGKAGKTALAAAVAGLGLKVVKQ